MKKFLFADLDDSLFQTPHKCDPALQPSSLMPVAYYQDGSECSYTTPKQRALLAQFDGMCMIPVTARDRDALNRVQLPERPFTSYAIINFGGVILLPDGSLDSTWQTHMQAQMASALQLMPSLLAMLEQYLARQAWQGRARLVEDCGQTFYALVKESDRSAPHLAQMEQDLLSPWLEDEGRDFYIHRNANNLAILPRCLNKQPAVLRVQEYLRAEYGDFLSVGLGDSCSDAQFLHACDYAILPRHSQLARASLESL